MLPSAVGEQENLGRGVFESKFARRKTSPALANFYRKALLPGSMSVDRVDIADLNVLCAVSLCSINVRVSGQHKCPQLGS